MRERWTSHFLACLRGEFSVVSQVLLSSYAAAVGLCVRQMRCSHGTRELPFGTKWRQCVAPACWSYAWKRSQDEEIFVKVNVWSTLRQCCVTRVVFWVILSCLPCLMTNCITSRKTLIGSETGIFKDTKTLLKTCNLLKLAEECSRSGYRMFSKPLVVNWSEVYGVLLPDRVR